LIDRTSNENGYNRTLEIARSSIINDRNSMISRSNNYYRRHTLREVGLLSAVLNKLQRMRLKRLPVGRTALLRSKHARFALVCRAGTSDLDVFGQIFQMREYRCLDDVMTADLIVDCGANVGYSAAYFLSRFPEAMVVAVEPDSQNFSVLEANVRPFGARAICICQGIWSHTTGLIFVRDTLGQCDEWARRVREIVEGETADVYAIDIGSILQRSGKKRISILKIDIEGSEAAVFAKNFESWIDKVDNLVIELHGAYCEEVFARAISERGFQISRCEELTVCRRPACAEQQ
jgi:FkbM family methyltransferase